MNLVGTENAVFVGSIDFISAMSIIDMFCVIVSSPMSNMKSVSPVIEGVMKISGRLNFVKPELIRVSVESRVYKLSYNISRYAPLFHFNLHLDLAQGVNF